MSGGLAVLVPAYEAARSLPHVLAGLAESLPGVPVLVLDDGSRDGTAQAARNAGVEVFSHLRNQGKGAALRRGWELLFLRGHAAVLCLDADGQHDPAEAPALVAAWREGGAGLVVGDRGVRSTPMAWDRRLSNRLSTALVNRVAGLRLADSQCGYRLMDRGCWEQVADGLRGRAFELESELIVKAARSGQTIVQVPVRQRPPRAASHVRRLPDSLRFLAGLWRGMSGEGR